jgi:ATP-binding cassette subfamily F protein 3
MSLIVAQNVSKSWSDADVLKNVSVTLSPHERAGLVGPNGQGKTTFLRILAGLEPATEGSVQKSAGLRTGYLPQDPPALEGSTLHGAMLEVFADLVRIEAEMHELAPKLGSGDKKLLAHYGELQHQLEARDGYTYTNRVEQVLTGLHFPRDHWDRPLSQLSGGQRTRAYLGKLLLEEPDVLLLDEPTNHLDIEATEWLEGWLAAFPGAAVVVSHDRWFLDTATDRTWEVSYAHLESYRGAYSHYAVQREERFADRLRRWEAQREYIEQTLEFIRRFGAGQRSQEAQGRKTRLERFMRDEAIPRPMEHPRINVRLMAGSRTGDFVWRAKDLKVGYAPAKPLLTIPELEVQRGQRVAIVGANGSGKTTLLRTILGELSSLGGVLRPGANVRLGYLSQTHSELSEEMTALECLRQIEPSLQEEKARSLLGALLLSGDDAFKKVSELSGGQRSRLTLARLVLQKANVLVMDEPTNHLDIASQEALQQVLSEYDGTVIFVSHDRYLIRALATHIWAVTGGTVTPMSGDWEKYVRWRDGQTGAVVARGGVAQAAKAKETRKENHKDRRKKTNESLASQRRLAAVEKEIHKLEAELKGLQDRIGQAGEAGDVDRVTKLGLEYEQADGRLRELFAEWEKLGAEVEE